MKVPTLLVALLPSALALGQNATVTLKAGAGLLQLAGNGLDSQILVSANDWFGVLRVAQDLAGDVGKVVGKNLTLGNYEAKKPKRDVPHTPPGGGPPIGGGGPGPGPGPGHGGKPPPSPGHDGIQPHGKDTTVIYTFHPTTNNVNYTVGPEQNFTGPTLVNGGKSKTVIIAGTIGKSDVINALIASGKLNAKPIIGKWEGFISEVISNPLPGVDKALVIAGADLRGTIYGLYDVSEQIGVSPWYWWADSPVRKAQGIWALGKKKIQGSPSVKYRGFFLNDEQPALTNWVNDNYAPGQYGPGFNHYFHSHVFELLLRLRANYLWPTMWNSMFGVDDTLNQPLADAYGVVMGSSHTEPMARATNEWNNFGAAYGGNGQWAYTTNNASISKFFEYGAKRAKPYAANTLFTMATRGLGDNAITLTQEEAIASVTEVVKEQRRILSEVLNGTKVEDVPQMWCLYKEVLGYFDAGMEVPEDITLLYAEDNWGNTRRLPIGNETKRSGGAGVYYHFDYVGDPRDYKWINTIQLEKTLEQMKLTYARQADRIWIVNVGDLKPLEIPISHYFDLAYDTNRWGYDSVPEWLKLWAAREFGPEQADAISSVVDRYGTYAARRKYELIGPETFSVNNYNEADAVVAQWAALGKDAQAIYDKLDAAAQPAFYQMVLQPVLGGGVVTQIHVATGKNIHYAEQKRNWANDVAQKVLDLFKEDHVLTKRYHDLLDGKWNHILDQTHLGYNWWQQPMRNMLPPLTFVQTLEDSLAGDLGVAIEASNATVSGDDNYHPNSGATLALPPMDPYGPKTRWIDIFARGTGGCDWNLTSSANFVKLSQSKGTTGTNGSDVRVFVSVDWSKAPPAPNTTTVTIKAANLCAAGWGNYGPPSVTLPVNNVAVPIDFSGFIESDKHVTIEAEHTSRNTAVDGVSYLTLLGHGRTLSGVTLMPVLAESQAVGKGPVLEYDIYTFTNTSKANLTLYLSPSHNQMGKSRPLKYAIAFDAETPQVIQPVQNIAGAEGTNLPPGWNGASSDGIWGLSSGNSTTTRHNLNAVGKHTLKIWMLEPGLIIQKIILDLGGVRPSYLGPPESFRAGVDKVGSYDGTNFAGIDVGKVL